MSASPLPQAKMSANPWDDAEEWDAGWAAASSLNPSSLSARPREHLDRVIASFRRGSAAVTRSGRLETLIFGGATGVALLHALDDAFLNRQPGVGLGQHALAALIVAGVGLTGALMFRFLRPGFRSALALLFGVFAFLNGVLHLVHVAATGPAGSDLTGVLAAAAGAVLMALGVAIPWRQRGEGAATRGRRWARRVVALVAGVILVYVFVYPVGFALVQTHTFRDSIGEPPSAAYEPVTFSASDGLELSGWYRPSKNGAAVILVHGGGSDRTGAQAHAELLVRHGYGVLLYDARGRGESDGTPNGFGWGWEKDVAGALAFTGKRADVDPARIGALGLSTGADVVIQVAAERKNLRAVVADGASGRSFGDHLALGGLNIRTPLLWSMYTAAEVFSGSSPGPPLEDLLPRISPTPLLLISGGKGMYEREFNLSYVAAAREPVELWDLPDVNHTNAIQERPTQYEQRVVSFFDQALLDGK
jgi:fermentation-respiration switch protein FrsA (DUF1100 family)